MHALPRKGCRYEPQLHQHSRIDFGLPGFRVPDGLQQQFERDASASTSHRRDRGDEWIGTSRDRW